MLTKAVCKVLCAAAICSVAAGIMGCAADPSINGMTIQSLPNLRHHPKVVFVSVKGLSPAFLKSTQDAIWDSSLFKKVLKDPGADYDLEVNLVEFKQPAQEFQHDITIGVKANWVLYESSGRTVVMSKVISSSYTAAMQWHQLAYAVIPVVGMSMGEDFGARQKRAIDGAMRDNIVQGLAVISELHLD